MTIGDDTQTDLKKKTKIIKLDSIQQAIKNRMLQRKTENRY
jgi:hypothetical protein